jgi:hypothetical protein
MATMVAFGGFAQDLSLGATVDFGLWSESQSFEAGGFENKVEYSRNQFGGSVFFDAEYVSASLGFLMNLGETTIKTDIAGTENEDSGELNLSYLTLGLLGKYPIEVATGITLAPAAGITYALNLGWEAPETNTTKDDLSDEQVAELNDLLIDLGVIVDVDLSTNLYFRFNGLFGINVTANTESGEAGADDGTYSAIGFNPNFSAGVGFKL